MCEFVSSSLSLDCARPHTMQPLHGAKVQLSDGGILQSAHSAAPNGFAKSSVLIYPNSVLCTIIEMGP